jgi:DNA-directed RNA polymerase specialized sigma24 family protein
MDLTEATRPFLGRLTVIARRILVDEDLARDAVQEAMVSLWRETEMPKDLRAWLARTVVHRSLHLARCRSRRRRHEERARFDHAEISHRDDPARSAGCSS